MSESILITKEQFKHLKKYGWCNCNRENSDEIVTINKKYTEKDFSLFGKW